MRFGKAVNGAAAIQRRGQSLVEPLASVKLSFVEEPTRGGTEDWAEFYQQTGARAGGGGVDGMDGVDRCIIGAHYLLWTDADH